MTPEIENRKSQFENSTTDGGPAFPGKGFPIEMVGMSLRDYFAAAALPGILRGIPLSEFTTADHAYEIADAMLRARASSPSSNLNPPS
jgi:hypothetical protein